MGETIVQPIDINIKAKGILAVTAKLFYAIPVSGNSDLQLPQEAVSYTSSHHVTQHYTTQHSITQHHTVSHVILDTVRDVYVR